MADLTNDDPAADYARKTAARLKGGDLEEHAGEEKPEEAVIPEGDQKIVDEAVEFLAFVKSTEDMQREQEREDLEFEGVDPWQPEHRKNREGHTEPDGSKVPGRPTLTISLLDQPVEQVINEARSARLALTVKPRSGIANTKIADHFKGLVRTIQVESQAQDARMWALQRTVKCGRGAYQLRAEYANDGDFDIDIVVDRILCQDNVYFDPYSQKADCSDGERCLTTEWMSKVERLRRWPDKPVIPPSSTLDGAGMDHPWFQTADDGKSDSVLVAVLHKVVHTKKTLFFHPSFGQGFMEEMPPEFKDRVKANDPQIRTREVDTRKVMQYTVDGTQLLETAEWLGRYIPVIPVIGKEYNIRGRRIWKGMVTNTKDVLRAINVLISSVTEIAGQMPRIPYIMAVGQDSGIEEMWDDAATKAFTRLYYNPVSVGQVLAPAPARQSYELEIQGLMFLLRMLMEMFHGITGVVPPSMRGANPIDRSGKAIEALQKQGQLSTSNYLDNLAQISMVHEGRVLVDAIPKYYDRPGRIINVMGEENDDENAIMVKRPFVRDEEGGPKAVPCPACNGQGVTPMNPAQGLLAKIGLLKPLTCKVCEGDGLSTVQSMPEEFEGMPVEYIDFSEGQFKVAMAVDRQYKTKQEEALAGMNALAESAPELTPTYADLWVRAMGFSGANEIADRIQSQNPAAQSMDKLKSIPPKLRAMFAQLQSRHDQAMKALEEAHRIIETDQVKAAGQKELVVLKQAFQAKVEALKLQGQSMIKKDEQRVDAATTLMQEQVETLRLEMQHKHEIILQLLKEKAAKDTERHSVELHAAAASEAAREAGIQDDMAAMRDAELEDGAATRDAALKEGAARSDHVRGEVGARADHGRQEASARADHVRGEMSARADHVRGEVSARADAKRGEAQAQRDHKRAGETAKTQAELDAEAREHEASLQPPEEPEE